MWAKRRDDIASYNLFLGFSFSLAFGCLNVVTSRWLLWKASIVRIYYIIVCEDSLLVSFATLCHFWNVTEFFFYKLQKKYNARKTLLSGHNLEPVNLCDLHYREGKHLEIKAKNQSLEFQNFHPFKVWRSKSIRNYPDIYEETTLFCLPFSLAIGLGALYSMDLRAKRVSWVMTNPHLSSLFLSSVSLSSSSNVGCWSYI